MSSCSYSIDSYITALEMSSKKRILVEGRHDRLHLYQLVYKFYPHSKIQIDTAQDIKSSDKATAKNNRLKIELIHSRVKDKNNIWFLCDREFREFSWADKIEDTLNAHYCNDSLYWTLGHSLENYFFDSDVIIDAFKYLSPSEYKFRAVEIFRGLIPSSFDLFAAISLSAKKIDKAGLPSALISWRDLTIDGNKVVLERRDAYEKIDDVCVNEFFNGISEFIPKVVLSNDVFRPRVIRGHTGVLLLQRLFSACLYFSGKDDNRIEAERSANYFSNISEISVTTALSESWVRMIGVANPLGYPEPLIQSISG
ncbi:DUF4435 domain-containing protein [Pectobacterium brasiliense]|uniref:DUF4435 domain-containing protein n=1 Tax=Pectobacterium brasiliense TaxID=180957 RepID=UPI002405E7D2|nr:DUF4435 domain-containing protein [Pectobacterium brasiliense]MDG0806492.1 DUF4435 domain-containing protein [Pectobacterium brasiliense]